MAKVVWRVKLVAERHPGVTTETELACIERGKDVGLADLGLRLAAYSGDPERPIRSIVNT